MYLTVITDIAVLLPGVCGGGPSSGSCPVHVEGDLFSLAARVVCAARVHVQLHLHLTHNTELLVNAALHTLN